MGTQCHVIIAGGGSVSDDLLELARTRIDLLEQSWSRFRPGSELSRLNAAAGCGPLAVSADLLLLAQRMREAWMATDGLFDPTVLTTMRAHGYDTDFATVAMRSTGCLDDVRLAAAPGMSAVRIDEVSSTIALPRGAGLDPGAIGKGLAADIVADELHAAGAQGVLVNLGGDIALAGEPADGTLWTIDVEDGRATTGASREVLRPLVLGTVPGGVATSTTLKRRWAQGRRHHVLDPRTGTMSSSDLVQVTVIAPTACTAEWSATAALLQPLDAASAWLRERGLEAILLTADRTVRLEGVSSHG
jgi:thiamine biosynthesis lipoprotein